MTVLRDLAGMTEEQLAMARSLPSWVGRVAAAHTVVREARAEKDYRFDPARFTSFRVPTLLLRGSESPPWLQAGPTLSPAHCPGHGWSH